MEEALIPARPSSENVTITSPKAPVAPEFLSARWPKVTLTFLKLDQVLTLPTDGCLTGQNCSTTISHSPVSSTRLKDKRKSQKPNANSSLTATTRTTRSTEPKFAASTNKPIPMRQKCLVRRFKTLFKSFDSVNQSLRATSSNKSRVDLCSGRDLLELIWSYQSNAPSPALQKATTVKALPWLPTWSIILTLPTACLNTDCLIIRISRALCRKIFLSVRIFTERRTCHNWRSRRLRTALPRKLSIILHQTKVWASQSLNKSWWMRFNRIALINSQGKNELLAAKAFLSETVWLRSVTSNCSKRRQANPHPPFCRQIWEPWPDHNKWSTLRKARQIQSTRRVTYTWKGTTRRCFLMRHVL